MAENCRLISSRAMFTALAVAAILFGVAMMHPYPRQSVFGPKLRGRPWCVWEDAVRRHVHRGEYEKTSWAKLMRWMNVRGEQLSAEELFGNERNDLLPLWIHLSADADLKVRKKVFVPLTSHRDAAVLPALRRLLNDDDRELRRQAACYLWIIADDKQGAPLLIKELDSADWGARQTALHWLDDMTPKSPELFDVFAKLAKDPEAATRTTAMKTLPKFGKRSVPILASALKDEDQWVRVDALGGLATLGSDAREAIPAIQAVPKYDFAYADGKRALFAIDPIRFAQFDPKAK